MACSAHVEKGDTIAVSAAVEQPGRDGGWGIGITRGTVLQGLETGKFIHSCGFNSIFSWHKYFIGLSFASLGLPYVR